MDSMFFDDLVIDQTLSKYYTRRQEHSNSSKMAQTRRTKRFEL